MRAAIYARISKDVEETGLGVDRQREDCERLAARRGWAVAHVYVENGVSAFDRRKVRPQYRAMMDAIEAGDIDAVVVWDIDRLYRQPIELEQLVTLAESGRVKLATCSGDIDLSTDNGIFMARTLVNVANKSSKDTSRRIKRAQQQAAERGMLHGMRPYGYNKVGGKVVKDPAEAAHVRYAVDALKRGVSLRTVCRDINAAGARTQKGNAFKPADLIRTLLNPALFGARTRHGQVANRNAWEAIISEDEHHELRTLHRTGSRPGHPATHLLSGILRCAKCGGGLLSITGGRYGCPDKEKGGCNGCSISAADAEREVVEYVHRWIGAQRSSVGSTPVVPVDVAQRERDRLTELGDAFGDGRITMEDWTRQKARIEQRIRDIQQRAAQQAIEDADAARADALEVRWPNLDVEERRAVIRSVLVHVNVKPASKVGPFRFDPSRLTYRLRGDGALAELPADDDAPLTVVA